MSRGGMIEIVIILQLVQITDSRQWSSVIANTTKRETIRHQCLLMELHNTVNEVFLPESQTWV